MGWQVSRDPWFGCLIWEGPINSNGYPTYWPAHHLPRQAYLVAWELENGPIPAGKELDHLCRRRLCVAVPHFELVSRAENQKRKFWHYRSHLAACPKGHDLRVHGRRTPEGGQVCRICSGVWTPDEKDPELT